MSSLFGKKPDVPCSVVTDSVEETSRYGRIDPLKHETWFVPGKQQRSFCHHREIARVKSDAVLISRFHAPNSVVKSGAWGTRSEC